jgi:hypothetical protein
MIITFNMEMEIIMYCVLLGSCYAIVTQPGELLQKFARYINMSNNSDVTKKLILCPYCLFTWISILAALLLDANPITTGAITMIFIYLFVKIIK